MDGRCSRRSACAASPMPRGCACSAPNASATIGCCMPFRRSLVRADEIDAALADLRAGRFVILTEAETGESQLCMAADLATPEAVNFMAMHGRGLVCLALTEERLRKLGIPLMAPDAPSVLRRSYGASIEARRGVTTGI